MRVRVKTQTRRIFWGMRILRARCGGFSVRFMTTFVLVHGAWGGSWGFRLVRGPLRQAGHEVFTPSLTGIGERAHLASPQVNLSTHVLDVVNTILYEDLTDIVLLGFSYGGMVVTGALEHVADRVSHLVYLDAFVPADGQTLDDLTGAGVPAGRRRARGDVAGGADVPADETTPPRPTGPPRAARRTRSAASPSRSGWSGRLRSTRSPGRTSRPRRSPGPPTAAAPPPSGRPPTTRRQARTGATGRSTATT